MNSVAELVAELLKLPQDLPPLVTIATGSLTIADGEVQPVRIGSAAVGPADFGQCVLVTGDTE